MIDAKNGELIEIAGAGPAGLAAAITLAQAGRKVLVHETQKEVGHRFGGDFQGLENWTTEDDVLMVLKTLGITTEFTAMPCRNGTVFGPTGKAYEIKSDDPLIYLIERGPGPGTLDTALLKQAQTLGIEVRFNDWICVTLNHHGGSGNFRIPRSAYSGPHPLVGEQAGFQDTLWGFGMRLAISSGVLAAQSLLTGENYDTLWQRQLKPQMETSVINRVLYGMVGNRGYNWFLGKLVSRPSLRESPRWQYQSSWPKRLLGPWAKRRYESQRRETILIVIASGVVASVVRMINRDGL